MPVMAATVASSADARKTSAPLPRRFGKFRVEVETTVALSATRACRASSQVRVRVRVRVRVWV